MSFFKCVHVAVLVLFIIDIVLIIIGDIVVVVFVVLGVYVFNFVFKCSTAIGLGRQIEASNIT